MSRRSTRAGGTSRRGFLKGSVAASAAAAFPWIVPSRALGRDGAVAANDRIQLGIIGIGPRCRTVLGSMLAERDMRCIAICDVQKSRRDSGKAMVDTYYGNRDVVLHRDFHEILARPDIDAMLIATGDHWHAMASCTAARAGKDVYSEKPCAMTIDDCRMLAGTMDRYARVFQAGTQRRSIGNFQLAVQLAHSGKLGKIHTLYASVYTPRQDFHWLPAEPEPAKDVVDWDMWLGPSPWRPYNHSYVAGGWRAFYDFDSGATLLDWGAHTVDLCQWANNADGTTPLEFVPSDKNITATYANGVKLVLDFLKTPFGDRPGWFNHLGTCPVRFVGDQGWIETGDSGGIEVSPASLKGELRKLRTMRQMAGTTAASHGRNYLDCIRSRALTAANPHVMLYSHVTCHAAALSWQLGRKLRFDPVKLAFIDDDEANRLRSRSWRQPWRL